MELYYIKELKAGVDHLEDEQFRHVVKVMRKKAGDSIELTDGRGAHGVATITSVGKRSAELRIDQLSQVPPLPYSIHVAVALTKNIKRIEWAAEKMTELGVSSITPIVCSHSERSRMNFERMEKILVAAIKQSRQCYLPDLRQPKDFEDYCQAYLRTFEGSAFIAHLSDKSVAIRDNYEPGQDVVILVGPEGDFAEVELDMAKGLGCLEVKLGKTRLRTETAAVTAVAYIHALNE